MTKHAIAFIFIVGFFSSFQAFALQKPVPTKTLYHFGKPEQLIAFAEAGTIPEAQWAHYADSKNFPLAPFRHGLYGTTLPAYAEMYGEWFMAIHLRESCRVPERVAIISDLPRDLKFRTWLRQHPTHDFPNLRRFVSQCYEGSGEELEANVKNLGKDTGPCEALIQDYLIASKPAFIIDEIWPSDDSVRANIRTHVSWYIRDRDCIESIEGKPSDIVHLFTQIPHAWEDAPSLEPVNPDAPYATWRQGTAMLVIALSQDDPVAAKADLDAITQQARKSPLKWIPISTEPDLPHPTGPFEFIPELISSFTRCKESGQPESFRKTTADFLKDTTLEHFPKMAADFLPQFKSLCR